MKKLFLLLAASVFVFTACDSDDDSPATPSTGTLTLNLNGLEDLGAGYAYEGWVIVDGAPVSTGTFTVDGDKNLSATTFSVDADMLAKATTFVLSIEPSPDSDPAPAATKLLAGDFSGSSATLGTSTVAANGFGSVSGKYIVATPTDNVMGNDSTGIWFLDNSSGSPAAGLELPALSPGWKYEGWVVMGSTPTPVTTGTFTEVNMADDAAPYSGTVAGPSYPGEDFLMNAPSGLSFPTNILGATVVISVEPDPDNSPAPFVLKPLASQIPTDLSGVGSIASNVGMSFPTGTVSR